MTMSNTIMTDRILMTEILHRMKLASDILVEGAGRYLRPIAEGLVLHRDELGRLCFTDSDYFARDVAAGILPPGSAYQ
jgi:hypothetical protein